MIDIINDGGVTAPLGFRAVGAVCDIKGKKLNKADVGMILSDAPCVTAAIFTKNLVQAAPVLYDKEVLKQNSDKIYGVVVNSGNANACTGVHGFSAAQKVSQHIEKSLKLPKNSILNASTGVIGVQLPYEKIIEATPAIIENLSDDGGSDFANSIMTTDTFAKEIAVIVETSGGIFTIGGATKGAGMIAPSLATMLTFITTDAKISKELLDEATKSAVNNSFNLVSVDGDTSTNDSVFVFANGMAQVTIDKKNFDIFKKALEFVSLELAKMIARDGEGATKFVTIKVKNARTQEEAKLCASKIANSPLVKTMFAGEDPNWGRLLASAGASGAQFNPDKVDIFFNDLHYVENGMIIDYALEKEANKIMKEKEFEITLDLNEGHESTIFYTCDFTADYVRINADYRS